MLDLFILVLVSVLGFYLAYKYLPQLLDFVIEKSSKRGYYNKSWKTHFGVGRKDTNRIEKAAIARVGLGGNSSDETVYWNAFTDSNGQDLNTEFEYMIVLQNEIPINYDNYGFWSITAYGHDKFLMENTNRKYLARNSDFSKGVFPQTIYLSNKKTIRKDGLLIPLSDKKQKFSLALRCYRPLEEMKSESQCLNISMPEIICLT